MYEHCTPTFPFDAGAKHGTKPDGWECESSVARRPLRARAALVNRAFLSWMLASTIQTCMYVFAHTRAAGTRVVPPTDLLSGPKQGKGSTGSPGSLCSLRSGMHLVGLRRCSGLNQCCELLMGKRPVRWSSENGPPGRNSGCHDQESLHPLRKGDNT